MGTKVNKFNLNDFAKKLKELRGKGTIKAVAKKIDISDSSWSSYENAMKVPSAIVIYKLAKEFNVSADYLLGLREPQSSDSTVADFCDFSGLSEEAVNNLHRQVYIHALPPQEYGELLYSEDDIETFCRFPDEPYVKVYSEYDEDDVDESDSYILFPYISSLLSLTFSESYLYNLRALEENIKMYCETSKEIRKLNLRLTEQKERSSKANKANNYYCEKTNGLISQYSYLYSIRYKIFRLICKKHIPIERLYNYHYRIKELEEELGNIEREIFKIIPSNKIDLDAYSYNKMIRLEEYNSSVDRLRELSKEKSTAINNIIDTLDYLSNK